MLHLLRLLAAPLPEVHQSRRKVRVLGAIGAFLGLVVLAIMGWVMWWTVPAMNAGGAEAANGLSFSGGPGIRMLVLGIYAMVCALGLLFVVNGVIMVATGRRYGATVRLMLWLVAPLALLGLAAKSGLLG